MKILLIGYGKMGKAIEAIALKRGHEIGGKVDTRDQLLQFKGDVDVAIEFTQPESAPQNLSYCFDRSIPVVCGTTGWLHLRHEIEEECKKKSGGLFYASNFSLGVNLFFKLNEHLAKLMAGHSYQISIDETHHTQKKDSPSGTAITLAEGIIKNNPTKTGWVQEKPSSQEIVINSFRVDPVPGTHIVRYQSGIDDIEIKHTAHSRDGFALGATLVGEWMAGKKGIYSMDDFLKL